MDSAIEKNVIGRAASYLLPGVVAISIIFVYAFKWTIANRIQSIKNDGWCEDSWKFLLWITTPLLYIHLLLRTLCS